MGWSIVLCSFLALAVLLTLAFFLPVGIRVCYLQDELKVWYVLGPIRLLRSPQNAEAQDRKKNTKVNLRSVLNDPIKSNRKYDSVLGDFWAELKTALELFWHLRPKLRIKRLSLKLHLGGEDPTVLAIQYGGAWGAIGSLLPLLEEAFVLKKRELDVDCNFSEDKTTLDVKLDIRIGLGRLLLCLIRYSMHTLDKTH